MTCECCGENEAILAEKRDYVRYICGQCFGLGYDEFYAVMALQGQKQVVKQPPAPVLDILGQMNLF